ncbi:hypothetical protein Moror_16107 [Moniliophthora roreri MCA 2997]|uniref:Uncharacterized protein n=1 Tax=Moniliophthora roreri (strain MCA 2997) TaxID=1381753 RepID=V2X6T5_MONRO|nr:hypothetical protein Moror_16107 [Moniliophthora roreri MCA 2997]
MELILSEGEMVLASEFLLVLIVCVVVVIINFFLLAHPSYLIPAPQDCKDESCTLTPSSSSTPSTSVSEAFQNQIISENLGWTKTQRKLEEEINDLRNLVELCQDIHVRCDRMEKHIRELRRGIEPLVRSISSNDKLEPEPAPPEAVAAVETPALSVSGLKPSRRRPKLHLSHLKPRTEDLSKLMPISTTFSTSPSSSSSRRRSSKSTSRATAPRDMLQAFTSDFCFYVQEDKATLVAPSRLELSRLDSVDERSRPFTLANTLKVSSPNVNVPVSTPGEATNGIRHPSSVRDARGPETTDFKFFGGIKVILHPSTRRMSIAGRRPPFGEQ